MATARMEATASPLVKAMQWILKKIAQEFAEPVMAESFGRSASALAYRHDAMETLYEAAEDYYKAYDNVQNNLERHGRNPGHGEAFRTCSRYFRLPEIDALEHLIKEIRDVAQASATLESEVVMRIEADLEESQRRAEEHTEHERYARRLARSDINLPNPEKSRRIAARLSALRAYGYQTQADEQERERERAEDKAERIQRRGSEAMGYLETIKSAMRRHDGPFVYLDKELCRQWKDALDL